MPTPDNRPRQLLLIAHLLSSFGTQSVASAVEAVATSENVQRRVADRLTLMILRLPAQVKQQAVDVLADTSQKYMGQVDRVIGHFAGRTLAGGCNDWVAVFDEPVNLALGALGDLIDVQLKLQPLPTAPLTDLRSSVEELIAQIQDVEDLDDETRAYLLEVALHLLQVLQRLDLFGSEALVDLQGQFFATLVRFHPGLVGREDEGNETSEGRRLAGRLWDAIETAVVITGLPANALTIAAATQLALNHGRH